MSELLTNIKTMSSREIARLTGKMHKNVLTDCDNLNANYQKLGMAEISAVNYKSQNGQYYREYHLTKIQTIDLMTGYNIDLRIKINRRWEELERQVQFQLPTTMAEALRLAADKLEENESLKKQLDKQEPQVLFARALEVSDNNILIGELAKILAQNNVDIGQNRLFEKLRHDGYLHKSGEQYNSPTQKSMELKLFKLKTRTITNSDGSVKVTRTTKVTPKGQMYFVNKYIKKHPDNQISFFGIN